VLKLILFPMEPSKTEKEVTMLIQELKGSMGPLQPKISRAVEHETLMEMDKVLDYWHIEQYP
jgi:hypothetical protein